MRLYELRYRAIDSHKVKLQAFEAYSLAGALDFAKREAQGGWAELYEEGRPICQLELVDNTGVWLVGGPRLNKSVAGSQESRPVMQSASADIAD